VKAALKLAKYKAMVDAAGLDTSHITNDVHISDNPTSPGWGSATSGNDFIWFETTSSANATVSGGSGNDIFVATSPGHVTFDGGWGSDTVAYVNATQGATIVLGTSGYINAGAAAGDTYISIENAVGTQYSDIIVGSDASNTLCGYGGNDTIDLNSGRGNDTVNGGLGNDHITGNIIGTDVITGGGDKDTFDFYIVGNQSFNLTITDFDPLIFAGTQGPSYTQQLNDPTHDMLTLYFNPGTGVTTNAEADAAISTSLVGHDVVVDVHAPYATGTITLTGLADVLNSQIGVHTFTINDFAMHVV